jgi:hypothetical protein
MDVTFKTMKRLADNTVEIIGEFQGQAVPIRLSILQLAKAFGTDKDVVSEVDFGSAQLEERCTETRAIIERFPDVELNGIEVELTDIGIHQANDDLHEHLIVVIGEDLYGWSGEGVQVHLPIPIYERELEGKKYRMVLKARSVDFPLKSV